VKDTAWARSDLDRFVLAGLEAQGLKPQAEVARETLIRRVSLDLTGIPPTLAEIDAFVADRAADAYERVVDRLLASPCYGERLATPWLDAARYADSHGFQSDDERSMWRWRDWVIEAYNADMPFDRFTLLQMAGDLLADASPETILATGFHRNHRLSSEGGIEAEEFRLEGVFDRAETTAAVWGSEFGRTVFTQGRNNGRDHHPRCFTIWMAGGGIKGGTVVGETDDFAYNVVRDPCSVHDLHAAILDRMGINHEKLTYLFEGRKFRLTDVHGKVVKGIIS
jgi:hypothetical protein